MKTRIIIGYDDEKNAKELKYSLNEFIRSILIKKK